MKYAFLGSVVVLCLLSVAFVMRQGSTTQSESTPESSDVRFGFVRTVTGDATLLFDEARWLTGKEGEDAAIAAGICTETTRNECLPNDFFIGNDATTTTLLVLSENVVIALLTLHMEEEGIKENLIDVAEFAKLINDPALHWNTLPYQMIVENGEVTILEEVYVP